MIFILHGDNLSRSRQVILGLQEKLDIDSKIEASIDDMPPSVLFNTCSTFDMFGKPPFVILDISKAGRMNFDKYLDVISIIPPESVLFILSNKTLTKSNVFIKNATKLGAKVVLSEKRLDSNVFNLVNYVYAGNRTRGYKELRKLLVDGEDPFKLLAMLLYGLRNIAILKFNSPQLSKMAPFVKSKVTKQANNFTLQEVLVLFGVFYNIDKQVKTGLMQPEIAVSVTIEKILSIYNV